MVQRIIAVFWIVAILSTVADAKTDEEKKAEVGIEALELIERLRLVRETEALASIYPAIEKNWQLFIQMYGEQNPNIPEYALIRARAASAAKARKTVVEAWHSALRFLKADTPQNRLNLNIEAAQAASEVDDFPAAEQFFAAARSFAFTRGDDSARARLFMRIRELSVLGGAMSWRNLKDALYDMRKFAETFPMWTVQRLEASVAEAELRLRFQPNDREKRLDLSKLKAEIALIMQGMEGTVPGNYIARVRSLNYALEDYYRL